MLKLESFLLFRGWRWCDSAAASMLFLASAAVVLWQNAHLAILWDGSYTLDTSIRIAMGQMPYRDFPLVHSPLTFITQAAIIRLWGRVYLHHVLYAAVVGGLSTVLAWRITLHSLRGRLRAAWLVSLCLGAPLIVLGNYSILPFPSYDCDTVFSILLAVLILQRVDENSSDLSSKRGGRLPRPCLAGAALTLPLFFKQNIGLPFLVAALALVFLLLLARLAHYNRTSHSSPATLGAILAGAAASLLGASLLLHFTAGIGNAVYWTIQFAAERRLPGLDLMFSVYTEPMLLWQLPAVAAALVLLHSRLAHSRWARMTALGLLAAPFLWTLAGIFISSDADDRASNLLALWPLLLVLSGTLTLVQLWRTPGLRSILPAIVLAAIQGTLLSQQLWGSTYAIWPLLVFLIADMIAFLASMEERAAVRPRLPSIVPALALTISVALLICGGLYTASEERLSYVQLPEGPIYQSAFPALRGMAIAGPYLPEFEELLRFAGKEIPSSDGLILIPGEDPFYFATGRISQFPVLLFDRSTDPYSPAQLVEEARRRPIRWLIVKRNLQIKEDVTPQRAATIEALQQIFLPYCKLAGYDVYRRP
ncbi:MAG: hypothetical protein WB425_12765 [Terracidiphilus sp.]